MSILTHGVPVCLTTSKILHKGEKGRAQSCVSCVMHRGAPSTLEPLKVPGEAGGSVLPFKTAVHYHELAFCTPLSEKTLLIPPGCFYPSRLHSHVNQPPLLLPNSQQQGCVSGMSMGEAGKRQRGKNLFRISKHWCIWDRQTWAVLETTALGAEAPKLSGH